MYQLCGFNSINSFNLHNLWLNAIIIPIFIDEEM